MNAKLSDLDVLEIQKAYRRMGPRRGTVVSLMRRFGVTRPTILAALRKTVSEVESLDGKTAGQRHQKEALIWVPSVGTHYPANFLLLCHQCGQEKGVRLPSEVMWHWAQEHWICRACHELGG